MTLTEDEVRATILRLLQEIAPEADLGALDRQAGLRDQLDIDSMDFLNFLIAIHRDLDIDIPERDYPKLRTIDLCVGYVRDRLRAGSPRVNESGRRSARSSRRPAE